MANANMHNEERMKSAHVEWALAQQTLTKCGLCDWTFEGTMAEGKLAAKEHRESEHPELAQRKPKRLTQAQQKEKAMILSDWKRRKWRE